MLYFNVLDSAETSNAIIRINSLPDVVENTIEGFSHEKF